MRSVCIVIVFFVYSIKLFQAKELSAKVLKYTRTDVGKRCFWPLVKSVTVRVPDNNLLKHVTIVDLPGNGDRNKSRDQMWTKVSHFSTSGKQRL